MPVIRARDWPLAPKERAWDGDAARDRIIRWAGGPDKEKVDWEKLRSCCLWYDDEAPENYTSYKLHYVDIIDGEPHVVFRALVAIIGVLNGARGGVDIPEDDRRAVYAQAARQYRRFDEEPPELRDWNTLEYRAFPLTRLEVREQDNRPRLVGYAAVFNQLSEDLGGWRELIRPGAFTKTLKDGADVRALWNHNPDYVLGRTKSGTLRLREDDHGLAIEIDPPDTTWARDLLETIRRGDVDQMSFGFIPVRSEVKIADESDTNGGVRRSIIRELIEVRLFDVSPVTFPAYPQTEVYVRSAIAELKASIERLQRLLPAASGSTAHPAGADEARMKLLRYRLRLEEEALKGVDLL